MKAIILSAGQGSRLLPLTVDSPKCLLPLNADYTLLGWQLTQLESAGVTEAVIVTGFMAEKVEEEVAGYQGQMKIRTAYNPFYKVADNLASLWMVRNEMTDGPFIVLNGDTIFTVSVAEALLSGAEAPITLVTSTKGKYDADDMKVIREGMTLRAVGKKLDLNDVNAESIGFMMFQGEGAKAFKTGLEDAMSTQVGLNRWYLSVINDVAENCEVGTIDVPQDEWQEVDFTTDYKKACEAVAVWYADDPKVVRATA